MAQGIWPSDFRILPDFRGRPDTHRHAAGSIRAAAKAECCSGRRGRGDVALLFHLELETAPSPIRFSGQRTLMALMLAEEADRLTSPTLPMLYEIYSTFIGLTRLGFGRRQVAQSKLSSLRSTLSCFHIIGIGETKNVVEKGRP
jgi:hypothetical protein